MQVIRLERDKDNIDLHKNSLIALIGTVSRDV